MSLILIDGDESVVEFVFLFQRFNELLSKRSKANLLNREAGTKNRASMRIVHCYR